jgi:polyhydroxyalkanoate synthesis regulator phasin
MASVDPVRRSVEARLESLGMTRERAEGLVKELARQSSQRSQQARAAVEGVADFSRHAIEQFVSLIGRELGNQISALGVATKDDIRSLEHRIEELVAATNAARPGDAAGG